MRCLSRPVQYALRTQLNVDESISLTHHHQILTQLPIFGNPQNQQIRRKILR